MTSTDPIIHHPLVLQLGPLSVTGFGLAVLAAFGIGQVVAQHESVRRGLDPEPIADVVFASIIGFLLGAKLYYVILMHDFSLFFTRGGFVFWGGLMGGIFASWVAIRRRKIPFLRIADVCAAGIAAGYSVGRTGCWAVGDDYGRPWVSRFAVAFPEGAPPSTVRSLSQDFSSAIPAGAGPDTVLSVYPTQIYEVALGFLMFWYLWRVRDHKHAEGWLFGLYCVLAGVERFLIEFMRAKDDRFFGALTSAQVIAIGFVVVGAIIMQLRNTPKAGMPGIYASA